MRQSLYGIAARISRSGDRSISIVGDDEGQWIQVWNFANGECVREFDSDRVVWGADISPDGTQIAIGCREVLQVWDVEEGGCVCEFPGHIGGIKLVAFSPDGNGLVSVTGTEGGVLRFWDIPSRKCAYQASCGGAACKDLAMGMHATGLIAITQNGRIYYLFTSGWYIDSYPLRRLRESCTPQGPVAMTSDATAALFCHEGRAEFWDLDEQRFLTAVTHPVGSIRVVAVSNDRTGITAGDDCAVRMWDLYSGELVAEISGHKGPVTGIAHDTTGRYVATVSRDRTVRLWDTLGHRALGHGTFDSEPHVAMSADAKRIAVVDEDGNSFFVDSDGNTRRAVTGAHRREKSGGDSSADHDMVEESAMEKQWRRSFFACYSRRDERIAEQVVGIFATATAQVPSKAKGVPAGTMRRLIRMHSLSDADTIVVFWSNECANCDAVTTQIGEAVRGGKDVITVLLDETRLPRILQHYLHINVAPLSLARHNGSDSSSPESELALLLLGEQIAKRLLRG